MEIIFRKVVKNDIALIYKWLEEPFVKEFWDNTQEHKDDLFKFANGRVEPSNYCSGEFVYWLGLLEDVPYCMIMMIEEKPGAPRPKIKNDYLAKNGSTYSMDFMIGNKTYFGKGLAAATLISFMQFFKKHIDPKVEVFFIDPDCKNTRAKHVYEKAGFKLIAEFIMEGEGCFAGNRSYFLIKNL